MRMRHVLLRSIATALGASLITLSLAAHAATGKLTKREPVPRPPTDPNGCMIELIDGGYTSSYQLEGRAKRKAIDRWQSKVKQKAPPEFASWKHANSLTKSLLCSKTRTR